MRLICGKCGKIVFHGRYTTPELTKVVFKLHAKKDNCNQRIGQ